jgi:hypothetical protein
MQVGLLNQVAQGLGNPPGEFDEQFVRDEPFDAEKLERIAADIAAGHPVSTGIGQGWRLLPRFKAVRNSLFTSYHTLIAPVNDQREIPPAGPLIESFHLVEEQLQVIGQRLTWRYYQDLPIISCGLLAGYPRIYAIAVSIITNVSGQLRVETLARFLRAYQRKTALTVREMRCLDLTLRIVVVERLKRVAAHLAGAQLEREWQSKMELATDNLIADLISLSTLNWHELFERACAVDLILREDPAGVYSLMDFLSQDTYRRVVERVAKSTEMTETEVARRAVCLASSPRQADSREQQHVGYYLVDEGRVELEKALNYRLGLVEYAVRFVKRRPTSLYLSALTAITLAIITGCLLFAIRSGAGLPALVCVALLSFVPASEIAWLGLRLICLRVFRPRSLPRMDTSLGLPDEAVTMLVVPTIFSSLLMVRESLERIEAHYLANQDSNVFFALLGDWKAAPREEMSDDSALLAAAVRGIKDLNARYKDGPENRFHLFHRRRLWNESEGEWVGWEKKRGKLREFNRLLRGARDTSYTTCTANPTFLKRIRYVISLDSDTQLPRDAARKLVGTILHPLNRARFDPFTDRVTRGYGILQPLVSCPPAKARRSRIPQILSGYVGVNAYTDPVAAATPNIYQDLFSEGNYVGKALYDVDTFEAALTDCIPENSVLSHDLLEGLYARCALVTDVEIFDQSPSHYVVRSRRNHRWTRGDWQLLPWLFPRVRNARGYSARNVLSAIGRWKIVDNLRRSLIKPMILLWLIAAWTILPGTPVSWTLVVLLMFAVPVYLDFTREFLRDLRRSRHAGRLKDAWVVTRFSTAEVLSSTVYLAHQAYLMVDAISRTLYRMLISRKHLLEWITAAETHNESTLSLRLFVRYMWPVSAAAMVGLALLSIRRPSALAAAGPLLLAWFASPLFAWWMSRRLQKQFDELEKDVEMNVRLNARCTCRLFETSVADTDLLGGDHMMAESTPSLEGSPTSLGRLPVWMMAAHELGAIGTIEFVERLESMLSATETLLFSRDRLSNRRAPALGPPPQNVLIMETGNLAGFMRALKQHCIELSCQSLFDERVVLGITDTLLLIKNEFLNVRTMTPRGEGDVIVGELSQEIERCLAFLRAMQKEQPQTSGDWARFFNTIRQRAAIIEVMLVSFSDKCPQINVDGLRSWTSYLVRQALELDRELYVFAPWTSIRNARMTSIIRRHCASSVVLWNGIVEGLDNPPAISRFAGGLDVLLADLKRLSHQIDQSLRMDTVEHDNALRGCDELRSAIEGALHASIDAHSRYAALANRFQVVANSADFRALFDEEYRLLRSQFQMAMVG